MRQSLFRTLWMSVNTMQSALGSAIPTSAVPSRGAFILFEGVDRCGKTTQTKMLQEHLQGSGFPTTPIAELIRFPDRDTTIGQQIDSYLRSATNLNDNSIHLLFSANRWERKDSIENKLKAGTTLVSRCVSYFYL
jgi:dTMP kinase